MRDCRTGDRCAEYAGQQDSQEQSLSHLGDRRGIDTQI
jgi:hypothetical protein